MCLYSLKPSPCPYECNFPNLLCCCWAGILALVGAALTGIMLGCKGVLVPTRRLCVCVCVYTEFIHIYLVYLFSLGSKIVGLRTVVSCWNDSRNKKNPCALYKIPIIFFMRKQNVDFSTKEKYGLSSADVLNFLFVKMDKRYWIWRTLGTRVVGS